MRYMKEVLRNNRKWVVVYLFTGLFNAFMANYKADYFQKIVDGLTDRTITVYGISALDNVTEGIVMKNVLEQINHATVIAVAHRLSSIREFERIVIFRNGKIVGNGTFEELLENNSYFFELYRKEKENSNSMVM